PLSLTTIPGSGRAHDSVTRLDEALPALNAVGSRELATVNPPRPTAPPAPSGDAGTRSSGTPDPLAVGLNTARTHGAIRSCPTFRSRGDRPDNPEDPKFKRDADILVETPPDCRRLFRNAPGLYPRNRVGRSVSALRGPAPGPVLPGPASLADEDLAPGKEGEAHPGDCVRGRPWTANFRSECLCLPVVTDPVVLQVDLEELRFSSGARDFTSVIATLQTMLHDAGYAFPNLVPTWGRTLSPELLAAQDGHFMSDASFLWGLLTVEQVAWNEIAQGRQYSVRRDDAPFQTLDPEVTSTFRLEDNGDTLMLTPEEQELLGVAMSTGTEATPREHKRTTVRAFMAWFRGSHSSMGGVPEVVGTSSLASGDAPMLTPDENMSSAGGGSQGSPGLEPSTAMVGVYVATTGATAGQSYTAEQPTLYVPVAEYPPGQGARPPPPALPRTAPPVRNDGLGGPEEETKSDVPMTNRGARLPENSRDQDRDLQEADRQIAELRAALAARDELERVWNEEYRAARTAQAAQAKLSQEAWDHREAEFQERAAQEMERRKVSDQDFAGLQAKAYLLEKERAQEREEASAAIDETKLQDDEELSRIKREMEHQAR
ncbi:hypothetical protein PHMEG_00030314, partial [Phytophthora megakarya]